MVKSTYKTALLCSLLLLAGCQTFDVNRPRTDMRIKVITAADGSTAAAIPPNCPDFSDVESGSPWDNQNAPTFGCATQTNLAAQIANPEDLTNPGDLGAPDPVTDLAAVARYRAGETPPLLDPNTANSASTKAKDKRIGGGNIE